MEKNFKWGPWKKGGIDSSYGPFAIQEYEREGTKDVGEFKDIPAYQSRFDVVDEQSGHHEFDSRSDAMKYAEKSFKEWKKMQKTKKNARVTEEDYVGAMLKIMGLLGDPVTGKTTKTYQLAMKYVQQGMTGVRAIKKAMAETGEKRKDMAQNSIEQKKLAVIKSNAAPEVKLKALEVLSNSYDNAKRLYDEGNYKGIQWRLFQTDYNPSPTKMIYTAQAMVTNDGKTLVSEEEFNPEEAVQDLKKKIDKHLDAQKSYKNADPKLDPAKKALSGMLDQLGYKAMAREVMQESDIQTLKKYSRVVISEFEKSKSPKLDRVKALLGQLGVGS